MVRAAGVDFLWRLVLDAPEAVSASARALLVDMHTQLGGSITDHRQAVRTAFLKYAAVVILSARRLQTSINYSMIGSI